MEERGCNDSVYLHWSYGLLTYISVKEGWEGQTNRGIKIGDSLEKFLEAYPEAGRIGWATWINGDLTVLFDYDVGYNFDPNNPTITIHDIRKMALADNDYDSEVGCSSFTRRVNEK